MIVGEIHDGGASYPPGAQSLAIFELREKGAVQAS
jgi:hypothetical protein